jgi:hypothetical protein
VHNIRSHSTHLHQGNVVANILVRAIAERNEGSLVVDPLCLVLLVPPLRVECLSVLKVSLITLHGVDWLPDNDFARDVLVADRDTFWWSLTLYARRNRRMKSECFVNDSLEKRNIVKFVAVDNTFVTNCIIDCLAKSGLEILVLAKLVDDPGQRRGGRVAASNTHKASIGIEMKWDMLVIRIEEMAEDIVLGWRGLEKLVKSLERQGLCSYLLSLLQDVRAPVDESIGYLSEAQADEA